MSKKVLLKLFFQIHLFLHNFSAALRRFNSKFPIFLNKGFRAEIPIHPDRKVYKAYKSATSVESSNILTIIEATIGQNRRRSTCATFLLNYLRQRDSNQIRIAIVLKVLLIRSHFKIRIQAP